MTAADKQRLERSEDIDTAEASPWPVRRTSQHDRHVKREAVIRAAARAFNARGYYNTSIDEIAASLNVTKPTIYYYVANKEQLLLECIMTGLERVLEPFRRPPLPNATARERCNDMIRHYAQAIASEYGWCMVRAEDLGLGQESIAQIKKLKSEIDRGIRRLLEEGVRLSAPKIIARDLDTGLAIVEDLGREGLVDADGPIPERYEQAVEALALLHSRSLSNVLPLSEGGIYRIPPYDIDALLIEVELLLDWYVDRVARIIVPSGARAVFLKLWRQILSECSTAGSTWTLRDFHSPNLLWLPEREGVRRVGMIDFQDCVMGHPAYDVVSLTQDARVSVPDELEIRLIASYAKKRRELDEAFEMASFARAYAILGAQRATKILGIFARLDQRDGKPQYLAHMPRVQRYLMKSLRHPALNDIARWYANHLPQVFADGA